MEYFFGFLVAFGILVLLSALIIAAVHLSDKYDNAKEKKSKWENAYYELQRNMFRAFQNQQKEYENEINKYAQRVSELEKQLEDVRDSKISYDHKIVIYDVKVKDDGKNKGFFRPAEVLVSTYRIITKDENENIKEIKKEIVAYYLLRAYWKKGGWLSFYSEDKEQLLYKLKLNKYTPCVDSHGDKHEAMLTLKKEMWQKWGLDKKQKSKT